MVARRLESLVNDFEGLEAALGRARRRHAPHVAGDAADTAKGRFEARSGAELVAQLEILVGVHGSSADFAAAPKACCEAGLCVRHRSCSGSVWSPEQLSAAIASTRLVMAEIVAQQQPSAIQAPTEGRAHNSTRSETAAVPSSRPLATDAEALATDAVVLDVA